MSPFERFGSTLLRIAVATNVIRTRGEDAVRLDAHGGPVGELVARVEVASARLEQVATRLEAQV